MPECKFCDDNVSMPYTCSLCSKKHCSKHRLPESHNCSNIGHFNTDTYRKQKIEKSRLPRNTISIGESYGSSRYGGRPGTWTSGNVNKDILIGGLILGFSSAIYHFINNSDFEVVLGSLFYGIIGLFMVFQWRSVFARRLGVITTFMLWPIGVALTIVTSFLNFRFLAFGYFVNEESDSLRSESLVGYASTSSILFVYIFGKLLAIGTEASYMIGISLAAEMFMFFAIINIFPFTFLDGKKMWDYNNTNYILYIISMIFIVVYLRSNVF